MKNLPSKRASRDSRAREHTCQSRIIASRTDDSRFCRTKWTFSDRVKNVADPLFRLAQGRVLACVRFQGPQTSDRLASMSTDVDCTRSLFFFQ